ncbi:hypothetical protein [Zunongwangia sp.]|uniref:hypothetical protein n=1 Tax=Zunongwangia sp. TaxID=1965325 RepID=UPI003AA88879
MIKRFVLIVAFFSGIVATAQENTSSPYSYYGLGITNFKGTVENRAMGGISVFSDSIHLNLRNPAAYARLGRTVYSVGGSAEYTTQDNAQNSDKAKNVSLDYLSLGVPIGKFGFGLGLIPYKSVGYRILDIGEASASQLKGRGGVNKVYFSAAYAITSNLSFGVTADYNFGNIQHDRTVLRENIQYGTKEIQRTDVSGFDFNLGLDYQTKLNNGLKFHAAATYTPETDFTIDNFREIGNVSFVGNGRMFNSKDSEVRDREVTIPAISTIGLGIGKPNKWFVGGQYTNSTKIGNISVYSNPILDTEYGDANSYHLGGFFVPEFNSITSYYKRIVFRGGLRYEQSGLKLNGEDIDEFGISFGLGLPIGRDFSNLNLGFEYGQRGTTSSGLIQEDYFKLSIGLSLNDRWFVKRKFN